MKFAVFFLLALLAVAPAQDRLSLADRVSRLEQQAQQSQGGVGLVNQVQDLQSQVQQLQGQVEELQHQLQQMQDSGKAQYTDLDSRIARLEADTDDEIEPVAMLEPQHEVARGVVIETGGAGAQERKRLVRTAVAQSARAAPQSIRERPRAHLAALAVEKAQARPARRRQPLRVAVRGRINGVDQMRREGAQRRQRQSFVETGLNLGAQMP